MESTLPAGEIKEWGRWLLRRRRLVRVVGRSMLPLLKPGDLLFVDPHAYQTALPQEGELVVAIHPHQPTLKIVKRVYFVEGDTLYLRSDNPTEGTDSRSFGLVARSSIVGKVTGRAAKRQR